LCNLCSVTKGQQAIRDVAKAMTDQTANLLPLPGIFPDYPALIVHTAFRSRRDELRPRHLDRLCLQGVSAWLERGAAASTSRISSGDKCRIRSARSYMLRLNT
jgi:hypothetical protein